MKPTRKPTGAGKTAKQITVAALVLASAVLHPIWNALAKGDDHPEWVFFSLLILTSLRADIHGLLVGADLASIVLVWPLALLSACGLWLYGTMLVLTLRRGDLSIYYPIIRSSPLFIVCVGFFVFGERYSATLQAGRILKLRNPQISPATPASNAYRSTYRK